MKLTKEQVSVIIDCIEENGIGELALALTTVLCNANMLDVNMCHRKAVYSLIHSLQLAQQECAAPIPETS